MTSWSLENVEITAKENPESFFIPSQEERSTLQPGDPVRLHFVLKSPKEGEPRAERMWLDVTERLEQNQYKGVLTNSPVYIGDLSVGDEVQFGAHNIARTMIRKDDPRWVGCAEKMAFVTKMAFLPNEIIRFAYREKPDREQDSGWRFFTGHEDDEYTNNPNNTVLKEVGWLLDIEPTLDEFIREPAGAVYERRTKEQEWYKVTDWSPIED